MPPGTPLYGAYGQPLPPSNAPGQQARPSYSQYPPSDYPPPMHSPTAGYPPYDDKDAGRRRTRPPEEEHSSRPGPPNYPVDDDPRRRSPISVNSNGTPPTGYHQYQQGSYGQDRSSTPNQRSPSGPPPPQSQSQPPQGPPPLQPQSQLQLQPQQPAGGYSNPMSLDNLIGRDRPVNDIDQRMLGRLNRRS